MTGPLLVTGATGGVGYQLVRRLLGERPLRLLARPAGGEDAPARLRRLFPDAPRDPARFEVFAGDVARADLGLEPTARARLLDGLAGVVHLAARTDFKDRDEAGYTGPNVAGAEAAAELALAAGAPLLHVSTAYVAGDHGGLLREDDLDLGQGFHNPYERTKWLAEARLDELARRRGLRLTVVRPGVCLPEAPVPGVPEGPGPLYYLRLLSQLRPGAGSAPARVLRAEGDPAATLAVVPTPWVAEVMAALLAGGLEGGGRYHLTPARPFTMQELLEALHRAVPAVRLAPTPAGSLTEPDAWERLLARQTAVYRPYQRLRTTWDRSRLERDLPGLAGDGADPLWLDRVFAAHLAAWRRQDEAPAPAAAPAEAAPVREYFARHLGDKLHTALVPGLRTLTRAFSITVRGVGCWRIAVEAGRLVEVAPAAAPAALDYELDPAAFLEVVSGQTPPQRLFFARRVAIRGRVPDGLATATALEEFFRRFPYRASPGAGGGDGAGPRALPAAHPGCPMIASSTAASLIQLRQVPELSQERVKALHRAHLNEALISLMELGGYDGVRIARAEGAWLETEDGRRLLDLVSSYGALSHGHNHPRVLEASRWFDEQRAPDLLKEFPSPYPAALAHNLCQLAPGGLDAVFFCNSGTEAVEGALKLALRAFAGKRDRFVYATRSLHGKTLGSLSITGQEKYRGHVTRFRDWVEVPFGDLAALEEAFGGDRDKRIAGLVLEPIQGEGGVVVPPPGYLKAAEQLCRRHGALLILDEIQTGFGRTGSLFRCEAEGVEPDVLCLAKALGGGVATIGATLTRRALQRKAYGRINDCLVHTSTFGGRSRACAVALEALNVVVEEDFAGRARRLGERLRADLEGVQERHPDKVASIRGEGLMLGLELRRAEAPRLTAPIGGAALQKVLDLYLPGIVGAELLHRHGIVASFMLNDPRVLRIYPPLVASEEDLAGVAPAIEDVLATGWSRLVAGRLQGAISRAGVGTFLDWVRRW